MFDLFGIFVEKVLIQQDLENILQLIFVRIVQGKDQQLEGPIDQMIKLTFRLILKIGSEHTHDKIMDLFLIPLLLQQLKLPLNESIHEINQESKEQFT